MEVFNITNFKKGGVSFGFTKDYLSKRLADFKATVYGENVIMNGNGIAPNKLNLI
jgi:hypothetical protein